MPRSFVSYCAYVCVIAQMEAAERMRQEELEALRQRQLKELARQEKRELARLRRYDSVSYSLPVEWRRHSSSMRHLEDTICLVVHS